jgi:hypothetical protein
MRRLGTFLFTVGLFLLGIFAASYAIQSPNFDLLPWGLGGVLLGLGLRRLFRKRPSESQRFRTVRKILARGKQDDEENSKR